VAKGRPKKNIDLELVEKLAQIQCTQEEIAEVLGVHRSTLLRNQDFCDTYKKGIEAGKRSLRRMQWKKASEGSTTMQIWLGKQYLGQSDQADIRQEGVTVLINDNIPDKED